MVKQLIMWAKMVPTSSAPLVKATVLPLQPLFKMALKAHTELPVWYGN